jgi:hypothetical protein
VVSASPKAAIEGRIAELASPRGAHGWTITVRVSAAFQPRIEEVAQRVAKHVEAEDRERQRDRG